MSSAKEPTSSAKEPAFSVKETKFERCQKEPKKFRATYSIGNNIGNGSFATIKRARHRASQQEVALKVVDKTQFGQFNIDLARKEAIVLQKLRHANVIRCIDWFESARYIIIVLPLMKSSLLEYFNKMKRKMSEELARSIFSKIAKGVECCH